MFLLIDKPKGITSHDVVDKVRRVTGEKRVGHAGTLDPNATGLLIVGIGRESTKQLGNFSKLTKKVYKAKIVFGEIRDTDDIKGKVVFKSKKLTKIPDVKIVNILKKFKGEQEQIPPIYSAIKIKGKKAYSFAREGKVIKLPPRKITIYKINMIDYSFPSLTIEVTCSAGTYIRALARDIGNELGIGAYLADLNRTQIGKAHLSEAIRMEFLNKDSWKTLVDFYRKSEGLKK